MDGGTWVDRHDVGPRLADAVVIAAGFSILLLSSWPDPDAIRRAVPLVVAQALLSRSEPTP